MGGRLEPIETPAADMGLMQVRFGLCQCQCPLQMSYHCSKTIILVLS